MAEFERKSLREVLGERGYIRGPFGSALVRAELQTEGIPVYEQQHAITGTRAFRFFVNEEKSKELSRFQVRPNDLIISCSGTIGKISVIQPDEPMGIISQALLILRPHPGDVLPRFLYYFLSTDEGQHALVQASHGSVQVNIAPRAVVEQIELPVPTLVEQRAIAHILGTLDDKIDLNRRMNETMDAMARVLFKSWFVDFDPVRAKAEGRDSGLPKHLADLFPDSFEDSELGEIPTGWRWSPLYNIATYLNGAAYAAFQPNDERRGLPIIKIAELKSGVTAQTKYSDVQMPEKYRIVRGDILFSWSGNPDTSIDTFVWSHGPGWLNQHIFRVAPHRERERAFVLSTLKTLRPVFAEIARNKQTTGLGHVTVDDMKRLLIARPDDRGVQAWNAVAAPIHERTLQGELQIHDLAALRDTLLPKLISGELRIPDAEGLVKEAC
jgi:type I restriction enzyme S subunit